MRKRLALLRFIPEGGLTFALIGVVGFIVDGGILTLLTSGQSLNVYAARGVSFPIATLITWYLNRSFTFRKRINTSIAKEEYFRYLLVQVGGSALNLLVFVSLIQLFEWMYVTPIIPLAFGAIFGMIFNYTFSRLWVFKTRTCK